jgi:hypothetical protein
MQGFGVVQLQEDLWSVICQGQVLYLYTTEEEAQWAALALSRNDGQPNAQASVLASPDGSE